MTPPPPFGTFPKIHLFWKGVGFRKKVFGTILYIKPGSTVHIVSTIRRPQEGNEGNHPGKVEVNSADLVTQQKFLRPLPPR